MELPFSIDEFLGVFVRYNEAIWPAQVLAYALGLVALLLTCRHKPYSDRVISGTLAAFWLFAGAVYHLTFFRPVNPAATIFGALFIAQALIFVWAGVVRQDLNFSLQRDLRTTAGGLLVLYAMVLYPLLGLAFGHVYPASPVFGIAPCPLAIFTFGVLIWTGPRMPKWVLVMPLAWAIVGASAAFSLGMREDLGLLVAGVTAAVLLLGRRSETPTLGHLHPDPV